MTFKLQIIFHNLHVDLKAICLELILVKITKDSVVDCAVIILFQDSQFCSHKFLINDHNAHALRSIQLELSPIGTGQYKRQNYFIGYFETYTIHVQIFL